MLISSVWNGVNASNTGTLSGTFTTNGGYIQMVFTGSAWSTNPNSMIGVNLIFNGNSLSGPKVFTNEPNSHKALVPTTYFIKPTAGTQTVSIAPMSANTKIDQNDMFTLTVTEFTLA